MESEEIKAIHSQIDELMIGQNGQTVLSDEFHRLRAESGSKIDKMCDDMGAMFFSSIPRSDVLAEPRHAALHFMMVATPDNTVASDIMMRYEEHVANIKSTFETHLVGSHETTFEYLRNVPDTVKPVKAKLAYSQVPNGETTTLSLVWKVRMFHRRYTKSCSLCDSSK